jgi:hypothetical protein
MRDVGANGKAPDSNTASSLEKSHDTPMIDVYALAGTCADRHQLAVDLATTLMTIEGVPDIPMFRRNTAAFVHELPTDGLGNVDGDNSHVRVQVLTNAGPLDRDKQLAVVTQLTDLGRPGRPRRRADTADLRCFSPRPPRRMGPGRACHHPRRTRRRRPRPDRGALREPVTSRPAGG